MPLEPTKPLGKQPSQQTTKPVGKPPAEDNTKVLEPTNPAKPSSKGPVAPGDKLTFPHPVSQSITQETNDKVVAYLAELGLKASKDLTELKKLGAGQMGIAYEVGDKVLKITTDESEAQSSFQVMRLNPKSDVFTSYEDVFGFKSAAKNVIYGLVQEKLEQPKQDWADFSTLWYKWRNRIVQDMQDSGKWNGVSDEDFEKANEAFEAPITEENVVEFTKWLIQQQGMEAAQKYRPKLEWLQHVAGELARAKITYRDLKSNNLMRRGDQHVIIDLGASKTGQKFQIPTISRYLDTLAARIHAKALGWPKML